MTRDNALKLAASRMYLTEGDVLTIQALVREMLGRRYVMDEHHPHRLHVANLGAGAGTTALAVLDECEQVGLFTYDISQANLDWTKQAIDNCYPDFDGWYPRLMDAAEGGVQGEPHAIDLLLHDASHERDAVEADLRAWLPRLRDDAFIWVHDYRDPPAAWGQPGSPGVAEAVAQLVREGLIRETASANDHGIGWVGRLA